MKVILIWSISIASVLTSLAQDPKTGFKKNGTQPIFFLDSVNVYLKEIQKYDTTDIAYVKIYKSSDAKELLGVAGEYGAIYVFTKKYAKSKYWTYFQSKSDDYKKLIPSPGIDTIVQYVLNNNVLRLNFEGQLFLINDTIFQSIRVITRKELEEEFKVFGKQLGFQIQVTTPGKSKKP